MILKRFSPCNFNKKLQGGFFLLIKSSVIDRHIGKIPKNHHKIDKILPRSVVSENMNVDINEAVFDNEDMELEILKQRLEEAIKKEDFEQAAILRDKIKTIKEDNGNVV